MGGWVGEWVGRQVGRGGWAGGLGRWVGRWVSFTWGQRIVTVTTKQYALHLVQNPLKPRT